MIKKEDLRMTKQELNEQIKTLYVMNQSMDEDDVKKKHKKVYKQAMNVYGDWEKALRGNAVTKRKLKERQRFMLYVLMKSRYNEYGPEALRPKNIDQDTKDKIVESYKTLKSLRDMIISWSEDKVLYELRIKLLSGASLEGLEKEHPVLYEQMMDHFKDMEHVVEEYDKRFGTPSVQPQIAVKETEEINGTQLGKLAETMVKMNYIEKTQDLFSIEEAQYKEKQEISSYVFHEIANSQQSGKKLSMKNIYEENPVMFFAIKMHFGDLETAVSEMMKTVVVA